MRITLDYRNPTPSHCKVAVFVNGAFAGTLTLRQDEVIGFQQVLRAGLSLSIDTLTVTGNPDPEAQERT